MRNDGTYLAQLLREQQRPHPMHMRQQYHLWAAGLDQRSERPGLAQGRVSLFLSV